MKFIKTYEKFVNKQDLDLVYNKYYKDIDYDVFKQIISSDPTSLIDGNLYMGKYSKWLISLFRNKINIKNINLVNSLGELAQIIEPFKDNQEIMSKNEIKEDNLIEEFENYKLYIPKDFKDSCVL